MSPCTHTHTHTITETHRKNKNDVGRQELHFIKHTSPQPHSRWDISFESLYNLVYHTCVKGPALYSCTLPLIQHFPGSKWKRVEAISSRGSLLQPWWGWLICSNYGLSSTAEWTTSFQLMSSSSGQGGPHLWHYNSHTMRINFSHTENSYVGTRGLAFETYSN